jgi:hypothetical protein
MKNSTIIPLCSFRRNPRPVLFGRLSGCNQPENSGLQAGGKPMPDCEKTSLAEFFRAYSEALRTQIDNYVGVGLCNTHY